MKKPNPKPGPVQLPLGIEKTAVPAPQDGPDAMPDKRRWRQVRSLLVDVGNHVGLNSGFQCYYKDGELAGNIPRDHLALRWPDGWRMVKHWRPEREGILCVLEVGGSVWADSPGSLVATGEELGD